MKGSGGFFLVEVLVALTVLSGGIVLVFRVFSSCLKAARVSETRFQAALLVEGRLWEIEQWAKPGDDDPAEPVFEPFNPVLERPLRWDLTKEEPKDPQDENTPWRMWELKLDWSEGRGRETFALRACLPEK
ncbi:MAG: type II secretion system protein [Elusimicrobiota bacterium]